MLAAAGASTADGRRRTALILRSETVMSVMRPSYTPCFNHF